MALSQAAQLAKEELERLDSDIRDSESNLRILQEMGAPRKIEVARKLSEAKSARNAALSAIRHEEERNG